jgi:23S rRNA (uracil1939-C5)-methyltransferase
LEARLSALGISRVILVGCDVDAFARDSSKFLAARYRLDRLGALDLFPQTPHLESLALFLK